MGEGIGLVLLEMGKPGMAVTGKTMQLDWHLAGHVITVCW